MFKQIAKMLVIMGLLLKLSAPVFAETQEYSLVINKETVNITNKPLVRITINGGIPGPTLEFTEGDEAVIHVTNKMEEDSSVHWHGLLLPGEMDGVPGFNDFPGIKPGETFTYRFKIRQDGTYWYHAHSMAQEQDGHYGSIIIHPKGGDKINVDRDYVVVLSDFHEDAGNTIMANLKKSSEYYVYVRRTVGDFFADAKEKGFAKAWENAKMWSEMRMLPTDLTDISNYTFLVNGKTPEQNWTGLFNKGEKIRLRFINASAMSFFDVRIPGLKMTIIAADGQPVEPVTVNEFRFGIAETYDVIIAPKNDQTYTIAAEPIDRTGFALATLTPRDGMRGAIPKQRPMRLLTMTDMGMAHDMGGMEHSKMDMDNAAMGHDMSAMSPALTKEFDTGVEGSGWADAGTPKNHKALAYKDLRYAGVQKDQRIPGREITVRLGGNMERYIWMLNGKKYEDSGPINLTYGERVRLTFINDTMMAHPMHLHGMFVQLENGQPMAKLPNKHTVIVAPGDTYSVLLTADEAGEWAFHCHLLYHMMAGMMTKVVVAKLDDSKVPVKSYSPKAQQMMNHNKHQMQGMGTRDDSKTNMDDMDHSMHDIPSQPTEAQEHIGLIATNLSAPAFTDEEHGGAVYHAFRLETGAGSSDEGDDIADWDFDGWIGTDEDKLWLKSEGNRDGGVTEQTEFWAMYSRNISMFWDAQVGVRHDTQIDPLNYAVIGFEGLAPYFFETEAHLFISEDGDISVRIRQENDFLLTQKLTIQPYVEADLFAQDVPELEVGAGLSSAEFGIQTRYEFTREFSLYVDVKYEREFGKTLSLSKAKGEDSSSTVATIGFKVLF